MKTLFIIVPAFLLLSLVVFGQTNPVVALAPLTNSVGVVTQINVAVFGGESNKQYWIQEVYPNWTAENLKHVYSTTFHTNQIFPVFDITYPPGTAGSKPSRVFKMGNVVTE